MFQDKTVAADGLADCEPVFFDAVLTPHRSLSKAGFAILMAAICALSFSAGLLFFAVGAWPIPGFLGLDALLIYLAFRVNYRRAAAYERVRLSPELLTVSRVDTRGRARIWRFEPHWVRVDMDDPPEHHSQLTIATHEKRLAVGTFLTPGERVEVASALRAALSSRLASLAGGLS